MRIGTGELCMNNKLILTSRGLNSKTGKNLIKKELSMYDLSNKRIFLFHEPHYFLESMLVEACVELGFSRNNIILSGYEKNFFEVKICDFFYCGEGNTFEILSLMRERKIDSIIKESFDIGDKIYIGCSAGAAIAGISIEEISDFDKNFVNMVKFDGLGLFDGIIIPHYTKRELTRYIKNSPGIKEKYNLILFVSNERSVVIEV